VESTKQQGLRLLTNVDIQAALAKGKAARAEADVQDEVAAPSGLHAEATRGRCQSGGFGRLLWCRFSGYVFARMRHSPSMPPGMKRFHRAVTRSMISCTFTTVIGSAALPRARTAWCKPWCESALHRSSLCRAQEAAVNQGLSERHHDARRREAEVTSNITGVTEGAEETGKAANSVLESAGQLLQQSEELHEAVDKFVVDMKAA
jgi:hypothetical protein